MTEFRPLNLAQLYSSADQSVASAMQMNLMAFQASRMRQEFDEENALRDLAKRHTVTDPETGAVAMDLKSFTKGAYGVNPMKAIGFEKSAADAEKTALEREKLRGDVTKQRREEAMERVKLIGNASTTPYLEWKRLVDGGMADEQAREKVQPMFEQSLQQLVASGLFSEEQLAKMTLLKSPRFDPATAKMGMEHAIGAEKALEAYFKERGFAEPKSDIGKLEADFKAGKLSKPLFDAEIKKKFGDKWEYDKDRGVLVNTDTGEFKPLSGGQLPPRAGDTESLRKEFNNRAEVQNYNAAVPVFRSIQNAPDSGAGDLDLIYGVGKILDPGSVVREGEMALTIKTGTPIERILGMARFSAESGGRLTPAQREKLVEAMHGRVTELRNAALDARKPFEAQATRQGIKPEETLTLPELPELKKGGKKEAAQKTFDALPNPAQYRNRRLQGPDGTIYRSNGTEWVPE